MKVIAPHIRRRSYATNDDEFIEFNSKYGSGLFRNRGRDCFLGWGDVGETIIFFIMSLIIHCQFCGLEHTPM